MDLFNEGAVPLEESLQELEQLTLSAGAQVVGVITQKRTSPDPQYFIGSGKLDEIKMALNANKGTLIIFDHELSPSQQSRLEKELNTKVIDRPELILDIFAQRAHTREGKLQVELAQAEFGLTRLTGHGISLSRLGGGIGTRGPGETKLETDRRRLRDRISHLKKEIEKVSDQRMRQREQRKNSNLKIGALIGYTNAGKSSLLNLLTKADVLVQNKLFATLDPTTRRMYLPDKSFILLTDTVGFIRKLPHQLIDAFRATLEEAQEADFLIHVVDASHPYFEDQISAVYNVLEELKIINKPMITVFNKIDLLPKKKISSQLTKKYAPAAAVSIKEKLNIEQLLNKIQK